MWQYIYREGEDSENWPYLGSDLIFLSLRFLRCQMRHVSVHGMELSVGFREQSAFWCSPLFWRAKGMVDGVGMMGVVGTGVVVEVMVGVMMGGGARDGKEGCVSGHMG